MSFAVKVKYKRYYGTIMILHIIFAWNILTFSFEIKNQSSVAICVCLSSTFTKNMDVYIIRRNIMAVDNLEGSSVASASVNEDSLQYYNS